MVQIVKDNPMRSVFIAGAVFLLFQVAFAFQTTMTYKNSRPLVAADYTPYGNVEVLMSEFQKTEEGDTKYRYIANFEKFGCDITGYRVIVSVSGITDTITVKDAGNFGDLVESTRDKMLNRTVGHSTINQWWDLPPDYDWYEVRTTHMCPRKDHPERVRVPLVFDRYVNDVLKLPATQQKRVQNNIDQSSIAKQPVNGILLVRK